MMAEIINTLNHFAKEQPDKIAVRHTEDVLTYKELDEASRKIANRIQKGKKKKKTTYPQDRISSD